MTAYNLRATSEVSGRRQNVETYQKGCTPVQYNPSIQVSPANRIHMNSWFRQQYLAHVCLVLELFAYALKLEDAII